MRTATVHVDVFNAHRRYRISKSTVGGYVARVLGRRDALVTVVFVDSNRSRSINRTFLNHNYATDVISFTLEYAPVLEGEIYVNLDRAKKQATEHKVSMACEVARLVIHGALHLTGYNDSRQSEARTMKTEEDRHVLHWFGPTKERK